MNEIVGLVSAIFVEWIPDFDWTPQCEAEGDLEDLSVKTAKKNSFLDNLFFPSLCIQHSKAKYLRNNERLSDNDANWVN